ncbi:hypothetical protein PMZ80_007065 [Knufia obscura]|uniref:Uncharacterized protein n=2 Tax=Knufia TaxID=430999 RepID=A0AAN8I5J3_9EURO|nr:hypothetical protein PMZ80_007065 [Knufia obscura]KAK5953074.1 hypothetical protein OHC33_005642 [Knufia fluminis]
MSKDTTYTQSSGYDAGRGTSDDDTFTQRSESGDSATNDGGRDEDNGQDKSMFSTPVRPPNLEETSASEGASEPSSSEHASTPAPSPEAGSIASSSGADPLTSPQSPSQRSDTTSRSLTPKADPTLREARDFLSAEEASQGETISSLEPMTPREPSTNPSTRANTQEPADRAVPPRSSPSSSFTPSQGRQESTPPRLPSLPPLSPDTAELLQQPTPLNLQPANTQTQTQTTNVPPPASNP